MPYGILIFRAKIFAVFSEKLFAKNKELNMKRLQTAIVLGVVALFAMTSSFSAPKQKTIKLGFNIPLTGDSPKVGESAKFAGEIIKSEVNAGGGLDVKGEKYLLDFVYVDNELKSDSAINAANKLIDIDKVLASIGPEGSGRAIPAGEIYNDMRVPMITPWATNPKATAGRPFCFRACFLDPFQAPVAAKFASETFKGKNVAIVYNLEDDYSKTLAELFKKEWESKYGKVVVFESFGQKDQDFSVQLTKVVNSKADFLYLPDYYNFVGLITSQAKDLGWSKPVIYGYVPDDVAALTYDATYIVLQAIQDAGLTGNLKKDRVAIKDAMGKIKSFAGVTGNMKFTPDGDPIKDAVVVKVTKDGEFEFVKSLQP